MSLKEKLPGMRAEPGHRIRNIVFGTFYVFLAVSIIGSMADGGETGETTEGDTDAADDEAEAQSQAQANEDESESPDGDEGEKTSDDGESDETATDGGTTTAESEASDQSQGLTPADMKRMLRSEFGLDVYVMDVGDGTIEVDYYSDAGGDEQQLAGDIGAIAGAYSALVDDGYETDEMVIYVKQPNGEDVGEFRASADDAQAHADGELSDQEYAQRVLDSGEVYD